MLWGSEGNSSLQQETLNFFKKQAALFPASGPLSPSAARVLQPPDRSHAISVDVTGFHALQADIQGAMQRRISSGASKGWQPPAWTRC